MKLWRASTDNSGIQPEPCTADLSQEGNSNLQPKPRWSLTSIWNSRKDNHGESDSRSISDQCPGSRLKRCASVQPQSSHSTEDAFEAAKQAQSKNIAINNVSKADEKQSDTSFLLKRCQSDPVASSRFSTNDNQALSSESQSPRSTSKLKSPQRSPIKAIHNAHTGSRRHASTPIQSLFEQQEPALDTSDKNSNTPATGMMASFDRLLGRAISSSIESKTSENSRTVESENVVTAIEDDRSPSEKTLRSDREETQQSPPPKCKSKVFVKGHDKTPGTVTTISELYLPHLGDPSSSLFQNVLEEVVGQDLYHNYKKQYLNDHFVNTDSVEDPKIVNTRGSLFGGLLRRNPQALPTAAPSEVVIEVPLNSSSIARTLKPLRDLLPLILAQAKRAAKAEKKTITLEDAIQKIKPLLIVYFGHELKTLEIKNFEVAPTGKIKFIFPEEFFEDLKPGKINSSRQKPSEKEIFFVEKIVHYHVTDNCSQNSDFLASLNYAICTLCNYRSYFCHIYSEKDFLLLVEALKADPASTLEEINCMAAEALITDESPQEISLYSNKPHHNESAIPDTSQPLTALVLKSIENGDSFFKAIGNQFHPPTSALTLRSEFALQLDALSPSEIDKLTEQANNILAQINTSLRLHTIDSKFIERVRTSVRELPLYKHHKYHGDIRHAILLALIYKRNIVIFTANGKISSFYHKYNNLESTLTYTDYILPEHINENTIYLNMVEETGLFHTGLIKEAHKTS